MKTNRAKIVTILSRKGGAGKTAITSILARYFAEIERKDVLIIDFDGRGGLTSLFHHEPVTTTSSSIVELLLQTNQQVNIDDLFFRSVIQIENSITSKWKRNRGRLFLLPSKPLLDEVLIGTNPELLKTVLHNLRLTHECIILIDSGPDSKNIEMGIIAADLVFVPMMIGKQDVHPTIETIRSIINEQEKNNKPIFGGLIINRAGQSQWEDFIHIFLSRSYCPPEEGFRSNNHKWGHLYRAKQFQNHTTRKTLELVLEEELSNTAREIAEIIHKVEV